MNPYLTVMFHKTVDKTNPYSVTSLLLPFFRGCTEKKINVDLKFGRLVCGNQLYDMFYVFLNKLIVYIHLYLKIKILNLGGK